MMGVAAVMLPRLAPTDASLWKALLVIFGLAALLGVINGVAIGFFRAPAIIVTLGTNGIVMGMLEAGTQGGSFAGNAGNVSGTMRTLASGK